MHTQAKVGGVFEVFIRNCETGEVRDREVVHNLVPTGGLNHLLNLLFAQGGTLANTWYVGLMANYTPVAGSTMVHAAANEVTAYSEASRVAYTPNAASTAGQISNSAAPVVFTGSANGTAIYGMFIASNSSKGGNTGTLLCAARFASTKTVDQGEELVGTYTFGASDDGV